MSNIRNLARAVLLRLTNPRLMLATRKGRVGEIRRIIVVRPDHLGDLLFATPTLQMLREAFPEAHITGLVGPWGRALWQDNPDLDEIQVVRFPGMVKESAGGRLAALAPYRLLGETARKVAKGKYDLGIVLRFDHWWGAAMLAAAGVLSRWGYDRPGMCAWLTNPVRYMEGRHEVEQNVVLVSAVLEGVHAPREVPLQEIDKARSVPALRPPKAEAIDAGWLTDWLAAQHKVVIHPGTAAANKLWTVDGWAGVAGWLLDDGWAVAVTGAPEEKRLADAVVAAIEKSGHEGVLVNAAGKTANIGQLTWILDRANMVLGVDNGPLHIADALNKPSLHLYGPSDDSIWGPWGDPNVHRAFRAPGTHPSMQLDVGSPEIEGGPEMRAITVDMVKKEVSALMLLAQKRAT